MTSRTTSRSYNMTWRWTGTCARTRRKSRSTRLPTPWPGGSRPTSANPTPPAPHRHRHHPSAPSLQYLTIPCTLTRPWTPIPALITRRTSRHRSGACRSPLLGVVDQMGKDQPNGESWNIVRLGSSTGLSSHNHHLIALWFGPDGLHHVAYYRLYQGFSLFSLFFCIWAVRFFAYTPHSSL